MLNIKTLAAAIALTGASIGAIAQPTPGIDARQSVQERRIDHAASSGRLTPREQRALDRKQAEIRRYERRAKADGVVTPQERQTLRRMQREADVMIRTAERNGRR
ncbi:hypothetical protein [Piscinibacter koreensis]|uniref:DUF4148 domain-containing protein n=1 Tax=Piscinibacter koreensis TaxID=2742824 RepID=A0A7Y6TUY1_9BURK|nr:hypothetical protein [Schlegelella koreensis]NUZ04337.1 hypothetical protein [Schlegelella koreensis]